VNVWQWRDKTSRLIGHTTQAHQCRNFEKIRDWAKERAMLGDEISEWVKPAEDDLVWLNDIQSDGSGHLHADTN